MSQPTLYEFHNVPLWAEGKNPVTKSFTAFVLSFYVGRASGSAFFEVDEAFGKQKVSYASVFGAPTGQTLEFLIVTDATKTEPMAMITRVFDEHGQLDEDSLSFTQYIMRAYDQEGVLAMVRELPRILHPDDACDCIKDARH